MTDTPIPSDASEPTDDLELETVFATSDADIIPVIQSVLDSAEIQYTTDGESMMSLFPGQMLGSALHRPNGEMLFRVRKEHAEAARELLKGDPRFADHQAHSNTISADGEVIDHEE